MSTIANIPGRTLEVVLAPPKTSLEVMATVDQLTYLSEVLSAHIDKKSAMDAAGVEEGEDEIVEDDLDEDGADEE